ncbi:MAG: tetratricopeptide repeat protein [Cyanobacteria bacterium J06554_6]
MDPLPPTNPRTVPASPYSASSESTAKTATKPQSITQDADSTDRLIGLSGFQLHETVTQHLRNRRYSAALLTLAAGADDNRQTAWFWHLQGAALANLGRYSDALASFAQVHQQAKTTTARVETLVFEAVCHIHLQRYGSALARCDRVLDWMPDHAQARLFRGVALQRLGRYGQAYQDYGRALNRMNTGLAAQPRTQDHQTVRQNRAVTTVRQLLKRGFTLWRRLSRSCRQMISNVS